MADPTPPVTPRTAEIGFESDRLTAFLETLETLAGGRFDARLPISPHHDALDAIAHGINVLVGELSWAAARARETEAEKAAELRVAVATAEARNEAMLKAIPDLMFVLQRDGTYVDYQARDQKLLWVPPSAFLGRTVREVMPPALADTFMDALDRTYRSEDAIVVEYELPMGEPRFFEARLAQTGADRILVMVRDITEVKRSAELIHDLAGRLITRQEVERQRIARELHDDVSQTLALVNIEIDQIAAEANAEPLRTRLRRLSAQFREIARTVHDLSHELHPARLRTIGLVAALEALCDDVSQVRDLRVTFTHGPVPPLVDASVSLCLYRIVQEALHNVTRHSLAHEAQVSVTCDDACIALQVTDSGVGFDPRDVPHISLGLVSMHERVTFLKGQLAIDAAPGRGTRIDVRIPIERPTPGAPPRFLTSDGATRTVTPDGV